MKTRWLTFAFAFAFAGGLALAHGSKVHVKGRVEKIGADSLQVRTPEGKTVEVKLVPSTVYVLHVPAKPGEAPGMDENRPAKLADLAVGDAVVIHASPKDGSLEADEVKFSAPGSSKVASAVAKPRV
ncbi:MAG TPA: hypothetical protein VI431_15490 [Candidatus Acidoferrum sp.]